MLFLRVLYEAWVLKHCLYKFIYIEKNHVNSFFGRLLPVRIPYYLNWGPAILSIILFSSGRDPIILLLGTILLLILLLMGSLTILWCHQITKSMCRLTTSKDKFLSHPVSTKGYQLPCHSVVNGQIFLFLISVFPATWG